MRGLGMEEDVKFGIALPFHPWEEILKRAKMAEEVGFDSIWVADHLVGMGLRRLDAMEAYTSLAAVAMVTKKVKLGTSVTNIQTRHPAVLAQTIMTLDHISNGRVIAAVGAGEAMSIVPFGIPWDKPVSRMKEAIEVLLSLWTEDPVNYDGKFFKLRDAFIRPKPIQKPHPPLWIAANSPRTLRLTAKYGDGWLPLGRSPEDYRKKLEELRDLRRKYGRSGEFEGGVLLYGVVAESDEDARKIIDLPARAFSVFAVEELRRRGIEVPEDLSLEKFVYTPENVKRVIDFASKISFDDVEDFYVWGSPETCIDKLEKWIKAGAEHIVLVALVSEKHRDMQYRLYGEKIIPYFKGK